ncbi:MAG: EAL domain-containing protein [Kineosporiaceae bacterium]
MVAYVAAVFGLGIAAYVVSATVQIPHVPWLSWGMASRYLLATLLVVGELRPLMIARHDGETDRVSASSTFSLALVLIGPLSLALTVQAVAALTADVVRGRPPLRALFNVGQEFVTLTLTRLVFCGLSGQAVLASHSRIDADAVPAALVAAAIYFVLNNLMVAVVVALAEDGVTIRGVLLEDVRVQSLTSSILLGMAPVAGVLADFSIWMVPLIVLPLIGVQYSAWIATLRQHEALHDTLTGLPNRSLFNVRAERAITALGASAPDTRVGVMLVDLDHFKEVNDTLGHHVGDGLLREVASRITAALPTGVTVARLGGDEFAVLVPDAAGIAEVTLLAERVAARLREPVLADGVRVGVQASIGIAVCPEHARNVETLVQRADIALYRAKDNRGEIQVYRAEIDQHTVLRLSLLGDLNSAVDNHEFELLYQPQVDTSTGRTVAVEALMRWRHPTHGLISPNVFIPLAESTGTIGPMSRNAVQAALTTLALLRGSGYDISMAVNVSARLLSDLELPTWIRQMLLAAAVPPSRLTIEVTESTITADPRRAMQVLRELREIGVRLAVDDFGTGYSSLSYLRRLQPDELKIDKSFVLQMLADENSAVIVRSTVELGHGLGLSVVAEGVEDQATYDALGDLGADRIQGFHIARPMNSPALKTWLDASAVAAGDHDGPVLDVPVLDADLGRPLGGLSVPLTGPVHSDLTDLDELELSRRLGGRPSGPTRKGPL